MSNATEKGHYFKGQYIQISIEKKSQNNIPQEIMANLFIHRKNINHLNKNRQHNLFS